MFTFESYGAEHSPVNPGAGYRFSAWWAPSQLRLVQDTTRQWVYRRFEPSGAVDQAGNVYPGGWDHEHCSLCWETLSPIPGHQPAGYASGDDWLCQRCYTRFVASGLGPRLGDDAGLAAG